VAAYSYDLPAANQRGWTSALIKNWGLDSIITVRSAAPVDVNSFRNIGFGSLVFRPDCLANHSISILKASVSFLKRIVSFLK
jgi:hypothetical protein